MSGSAKLKSGDRVWAETAKRMDGRKVPKLRLGDKVRITTSVRKVGTIVDVKKTEEGPRYLVAVKPVKVELPSKVNGYLITEMIP